MVIGICARCKKYIPDSLHDWKFDKICDCLTKEQWIKRARKNKFRIRIDGELYDFT